MICLLLSVVLKCGSALFRESIVSGGLEQLFIPIISSKNIKTPLFFEGGWQLNLARRIKREVMSYPDG
jgi:hypothetical protein